MKSSVLIVVFIFTCFLLILDIPAFAQTHKQPMEYWDQAQSLQSKGQYSEAAKKYERFAQMKRNSPKPDLSEISMGINQAGFMYYMLGQYEKALQNYHSALDISKKLKKEDLTAVYLSNIGMVYDSWGQYDKALETYNQALRINRNLKKEGEVATIINNIGVIYNTRGQYEKAIELFKQSLRIQRKFGKEKVIAIALNNIGDVFLSWGQFDQALQYFNQALAINKKLGNEEGIANQLNNMAALYNSWGQSEKANENYHSALAINRKLGRQDQVAIQLNSIGSIYRDLKQYEKALEYHNQAMVICQKLGLVPCMANNYNNVGRIFDALEQTEKALQYYNFALSLNWKLGKEGEVAINLNNIGTIYNKLKQYNNALKYYSSALEIDKKLGKNSEIALDLHNIGQIYYLSGHLNKAIEYFKESVKIKEKLRLSATGDIRRDFLASQIYTYQFLTSAYLNNNNIPKAFHSVEISRAKLLAERLAGSGHNVETPTTKQVQENLKQNEAVLVYSNIDQPKIIQMVLTNNSIFGVENSKVKFLTSTQTKYKKQIQKILSGQRGLQFKKTKFLQGEEKALASEKSSIYHSSGFENVINYYRSLLSTPFTQEERGIALNEKEKTNGNIKEFSRLLYQLLIKPLEGHLKGKDTLIIIPDGILGFIPFETLIDEKGKYLVEKFHIKYAQSMGVLHLIQNRIYPKRKPMLAFGGAVYNNISYQTDMVESEYALAQLEKRFYSRIRNRSSVRETYAKLGTAHWGNLPGTLSEVKAIQKIIKNTVIITGDEVSESNVKYLSQQGKLAEFEVLHFATHGLVVPAIPELSALVLSLFEKEQNNEDGYLRMGEIAELNLKADFVNLSACETGLGKIYGGEGVVGLTQAFLIAGANSLSVSLWQVADDSTSQFMVAMYDKAASNGKSYSQAMVEIKRQFIHGDFGMEYKSPYYWSPFVYYGR